MIINKRSYEGIRKLHPKRYGSGIGSFLKDGLNALKATTKQVANIVTRKGADAAQHVVNHLKEAAKSSINRGLTHGKEILANVTNAALKEGHRIVAENVGHLSKNLNEARNLKDVGEALKSTAQNVITDLKDTSKDIAKNTLEDLKNRGLDMSKEAVKDILGIKTGEGIKHPSISKLLASSKKKKGGAVFLT